MLAQNVDYSAVAMFLGRLAIEGTTLHQQEAPFDSGKLQLMPCRPASRLKTFRWSKENVIAQHAVTSCILSPLPDSRRDDCQIGADTVIIDGDIMCGTPCKADV